MNITNEQALTSITFWTMVGQYLKPKSISELWISLKTPQASCNGRLSTALGPLPEDQEIQVNVTCDQVTVNYHPSLFEPETDENGEISEQAEEEFYENLTEELKLKLVPASLELL